MTGPLVPVGMLNLIRAVLGIHHHRFNLSVKRSSQGFPLISPAPEHDEGAEDDHGISRRSGGRGPGIAATIPLLACSREAVVNSFELFRSKEMLAWKEREAKTTDETALIVEEKVRLRRHQDELRQGSEGRVLVRQKAIIRGSKDNAIATFNASHRSIKNAIKCAVDLEQAPSEPRLRDLERTRQALGVAWPLAACFSIARPMLTTLSAMTPKPTQRCIPTRPL